MESYFEQPNVTAAIEEWTIMDDEFKAFCYALKLTSSDFLSLKKDSNRTYMAIRKWLSTPRTRRDFAQVLFNFKNISLSIKLGFEKDVKAIQDGKILPEEPVSPIEAVASNQSKETMTSFSGSNNPFAAAMAKKNQVLTVEKFVKAKDNWLARICVAANTHGSWQRLLGDLGLLTSPDIEKIVREYNRIWRDTKANNPMYDILVQLCLDSKFANQSVDDFSALLKTLQNPDLTAVLREWDEFRGTKVAKEVTNNIQAYDGANELKNWLIANEVSDDGDVEGDLALLQSAKYGVKTLSQLLKLRPGSFSDMSMVKAQTLEDAIARSRASTPIAPPK